VDAGWAASQEGSVHVEGGFRPGQKAESIPVVGGLALTEELGIKDKTGFRCGLLCLNMP